ncbi:hypothetical protein CBR_g50329 [Chara braunii]|uniref:Uncharacterized protein n=1 Tax=Chara braunii TaxID=69332 RepID=A0A388K5G2_CHABU|nr:hypothetical protein CBR_g50329 [Chara braunii]|eukprot:GBG65287.1 hypothetical protein CBR_g50329 [Chara braunii]
MGKKEGLEEEAEDERIDKIGKDDWDDDYADREDNNDVRSNRRKAVRRGGIGEAVRGGGGGVQRPVTIPRMMRIIPVRVIACDCV